MLQNNNSENEELKKEILELKNKFELLKQDMSRIEEWIEKNPENIKKVSSEELKDVFQGKREKDNSIKIYAVDEEPKVIEKKNEHEKSRDTFESNFGRVWLNKIGVVVFALGIGFLISYTFKYFTPVLRVLFGYAVSLLLFGIGIVYEKKERFRNFGLSLLAGGWAIAYFMTYAMYHFEVSRIVYSQSLDVYLLSAVALGMIMHAFKYKSEEMVALAIFIAFVTSTLGKITSHILFSNVILSVLVVFLTYKMRWVRTLILGVILTYGIHFFWVSNVLGNNELSVQFLFMYWIFYLFGVHFSFADKESVQENQLAAVNFGNFFFFFIGTHLVSKFLQQNSFMFLFTLGVFYLVLGGFMQVKKRGAIACSNLIIGIMAMSLSLMLKLEYSLLFVWLVEIPFLLLVGCFLKERIYRYLAYVLTIIGVLKFCGDYSVLYSMNNYVLFGFFNLTDLLLLWTFISFSICTVIGFLYKNSQGYHDFDRFLNHLYSILAGVAITSFLYRQISESWLGVSFAIEALVLYGVAYFTGLKRFISFSYLFLVIVCGFLIGMDLRADDYKWIKCGLQIGAFFSIYFHTRLVPNKVTTERDNKIIFVVGLILCVVVLFQYLQSEWLSLGFGVLGVVFVLLGMLLKDAPSRVGGLVLLVFTLLRILFVDLSQLDIFVKIISFIVLGGLFLVISYFYNKYQVGQEKGACPGDKLKNDKE